MKKKWAFSCLISTLLFPLVFFAAAKGQTSNKPRGASDSSVSKSNDPKLDAAMKAMFDVHTFQQASISPDGHSVIWVESLSGSGNMPSSNSAIYIRGTVAGNPRRVSAGDGKSPHEEHDVAFSPDSKTLTFLSDAQSHGQLQLFTVEAAGGAAKQLTHLKGFLSNPAFSPDGKKIAFLFTENASRAAGPLVAETPDEGVISENVEEQRLAILDLATSRLQQISPKDLYVYEFDWSPDSSHLVVTSAHGNGDNNWYIAGLSTIDANSGEMETVVEKPGMQISEPRWSLDGKTIAVIGGLMSDEAIVGGDVFSVPVAGGEFTNAAPKMNMSASWISWSADSRAIMLTGIADGGTIIAKLDINERKPTEIWRGDERVSDQPYDSAISLSQDGKTSAVVRQSFDHPPEVWAGPIGEWKQVTHSNAALKPAWGKSVSLRWKSDGNPVQGWLTYPQDYDPSKKYPLVVRVHGGPSWAVMPYWPTRWDFSMALPAEGYFVLQPNFRGSYGQGEAFTAANRKDWGYGDFRDIMSGVDAAISPASIDPNRLGLTGWSYGGYMSMWGVTQTQRFRAAVAGAGIANLQSYYGENKVDQSMIPFFDASVYDDPKVYEKSSPLTFIKNVKTPTLIVVGDSDGECPSPQSFEFWHALKTLQVPTELVIYPHEGHHFSNPAHSRDVIERSVAWFNKYLGQNQTAEEQ
jgi:dipeptidyl aminopeptidase/acylaminoacyl peptidase